MRSGMGGRRTAMENGWEKRTCHGSGSGDGCDGSKLDMLRSVVEGG